jgi:chromosome segregation ATPase
LESYQKEKVAAETSLQHLEKALQEQENQIKSLNDKIQEIQVEKEKSNSQYLQQQQRDIKQIFQDISQIEQLVEDSVSNQNLMKKLQEDEKKLSRLYSILSREIVLFALDDYLPILSDIINDYLAQCVDYSIQMHIVENNEKLELEAKILD